jgi:peroxiredoxin|tara:strand:+ start:145 stop:708 length:564 start_codon:yes stop_codon:yes gene_type:complete
MSLETPICNFGKKALPFELKSTENQIVSLNDIKGENGTLIMFICNHCPYVIATIKDIVLTSIELKKIKINTVAVMSNDPKDYPEDSFENMIKFSKKYNFGFPYLYDQDQSIGKSYEAVCTPDFFGYNSNLELQYRGRIYELNNKVRPRVRVENSQNELLNAMKIITETGNGPKNQIPSIGCSIKWSD